jgi:uncharacterized SAM-binding protein YcdF (DUF218 family)
VSGRLVAVLGYSARRSNGVHPVCAERLRHAEELAADGDTVLLSGWARRGHGAGEAELMREAWKGADALLVADVTARNTRENVAAVAELARRLGASEVLVVTSHWHAFRARTLLRARLREPNVLVRASSPPGRAPMRLVARELACLAALPVHLLGLRLRRCP